MKNRIRHWFGTPSKLLLAFLLMGQASTCEDCPLVTVKNFDDVCHYAVTIFSRNFNYETPLLAPGAEDLTILSEKDTYTFLAQGSVNSSCLCGTRTNAVSFPIQEDGKTVGVICHEPASDPDVILDPAEIIVENSDVNCSYTIKYVPSTSRFTILEPKDKKTLLLPTNTDTSGLLCATPMDFGVFPCDCDEVETCAPDADIRNTANSTKKYFLTCGGAVTNFSDSPTS